jgi:hypothetical protein
MRTQQSKTTPEVEQAHSLLEQGQREEAYAVCQSVLKKQPDNIPAQALRDRIDTEDFRQAVVRERERKDSFEEEDTSPLVPFGLLVIGLVAALVASYLAFKAMRLGFRVGFDTQIEMGGKFLGKADKYPVHILLLTPTLLYMLSFVCFYAFRRYRRIR